jgi:transposase
MRAYSEDLRRKIVQAVERGVSKAQTARLFGISLSSVKLYTSSPARESPLPLGKEVDDLRKWTRPQRRSSKTAV